MKICGNCGKSFGPDKSWQHCNGCFAILSKGETEIIMRHTFWSRHYDIPACALPGRNHRFRKPKRHKHRIIMMCSHCHVLALKDVDGSMTYFEPDEETAK